MRFPRVTAFVRGGLITALSGVALLAAGSWHARSASAFDVWCYDDPLVSINGRIVDTQVGVQAPLQTAQSAVQAATITYILPSNVSASLIASTNWVFPENVVFQNSAPAWNGGAIPVTIQVSFQATSTLNAGVTTATMAMGARVILTTNSGSTAPGAVITQTLSLK